MSERSNTLSAHPKWDGYQSMSISPRDRSGSLAGHGELWPEVMACIKNAIFVIAGIRKSQGTIFTDTKTKLVIYWAGMPLWYTKFLPVCMKEKANSHSVILQRCNIWRINLMAFLSGDCKLFISLSFHLQ